MSLTEFASVVGMSEGVLASLEYGGRPSQPTLDKLAAFLRRPVTDLYPEGMALQRRGPRQKDASRGGAPRGSRAEIIEHLVALHAQVTLAHERVLAAVRADDVAALEAARQLRSEILARQDELIEGLVVVRVAPEGARTYP
jgi:transcriptional regulator with XRE-family HTH domain